MSRSALHQVILVLAFSAAACVKHYEEFPMADILCGQPLPEECTQRLSSYSELPSTLPGQPSGEDLQGGLSEQGLAAKTLFDRQLWREAAPELERAARGLYGDDLYAREHYEMLLVPIKLALRDYGGAFDLLRLMLVQDRNQPRVAILWLARLTTILHCRARPALMLLAEHTFETHGEECGRGQWCDRSGAQYDALVARGLVELGRFAEARKLFTALHVRKFFPDISAQCVGYIDARPLLSSDDSHEEACEHKSAQSCNKPEAVPKVQERPAEPDPSLPVCETVGEGVIALDEPCREEP